MIRAGTETKEALQSAGARILLHDPEGASRSGDALLQRVGRLAGALVEEGVRGGRIGLWYANSCAAVEAFLAVEWIGGTRVPVDPNAPPAEAEAVFAGAAVDLVLGDNAHGAALSRRHLVHDDDRPLGGAPLRGDEQVDPEKTFLLYPRAVAGGRLFFHPAVLRQLAGDDAPQYRALSRGSLRPVAGRGGMLLRGAADHARHRLCRHLSVSGDGAAAGAGWRLRCGCHAPRGRAA
jgi:hypothetical protein